MAEQKITIQIEEPLCAVFRRRLKDVGLKYTPERAQILDTIIEIDDVFEAERLQEELKDADFRVSKATIYRTLKLLEDAGIIQRVPVSQEQARYMLAYGKRPRDLLIRVDSDEVVPFETTELTALCEKICADHGVRLQGRRLVIYATAEHAE